MPRYFSPSTGGFYVEAIHGARLIAEQLSAAQIAARRKPRMVANPRTLIPADAVAVEQDEYDALMAAQADGQCIIARGGQPVAADPLPPSPDVQLANIRAKRNRLLAATDMMVAAPDYAINADERAELLAWRAALRDIMAAADAADPISTIAWPVAPDWLAAHGVKA